MRPAARKRRLHIACWEFAAAVAEDYGDKDEGRSPRCLRAASLHSADRPSGVQARRRDGVIGKMFVDSSAGSEGTPIIIRKLQV
ncbi:Hypothetical predicted protein [Marmota monax]|uniref:Uncharacterized protein n=1 Tax=Marmota monax TaxID=9995 RepID=A0A5E4B6C8_MARMO|nr:hypothetical protein GHT09_014555 [Marmota monax]VTJ65283.1 Hypothetical predicted protein [Marmota monax]